MKNRFFLDKILFAFFLIAVIFTVYTINLNRIESEKNDIETLISQSKKFISEFLSENLKHCPLKGNEYFENPVIFDKKNNSLKPAYLQDQFLNVYKFENQIFDENINRKVRNILNIENINSRIDILSHYLNDINDDYVSEKSVYYLLLIRDKLKMSKDITKETDSFNRLLKFINDENEKRFLKEKLISLIEENNKRLENNSILLKKLHDLRKYSVMKKIKDVRTANFPPLKKHIFSNSEKIMFHSVISNGVNRIIVTGNIDSELKFSGYLKMKNLNSILNEKFDGRIEITRTKNEDSGRLIDGFYFHYIDKNKGTKLLQEFFVYFPIVVIILYFIFINFREKQIRIMNNKMGEFVAQISHQLKTPLSSSLLYLELAEKHFENGDFDKGRELLSASGSQARGLAFLFENYTVLNRIFSGDYKLELELMNISEEISKFLSGYKFEIDSGRMKFRIHESCNRKIIMDRWILFNIMNNLVSNSLKYSNVKELIIDMEILEIEKSTCIIFSDNGAGIKKADENFIFDRFYKGGTSSKKERSSGLGLYISRELALKLGGDLSLRKTETGASFVFRIGDNRNV